MLNIYGQSFPHHDAWITGTLEELIKLRTAIDFLIDEANGETTSELATSIQTFTNDGEGYTIILMRLDDKDEDKICVPYAGEEYGAAGVHPYKFISRDKYIRLVKND